MKKNWLLAGGAFLVILVYGPRLNAPLVWDDRSLIAFNSTFGGPVKATDFVSPAYFKFSSEYSWRPLSTLSYVVLVHIFGKWPAALRGLSLILHFLNGLLLLLILRRWRWPEEAAAWSVVFFWLHPANVESLMCAAFNKEALAAFGLLGMLAAHQRRRWGLASLAFALALLSKETAMAGFPLAVLMDYCEGGRRRVKDSLASYALYAELLLAYMVLRFVLLPGPADGLVLPLTASERLYNALGGWIEAARIFLIPARLRIEYFALPAASAVDWLERIAIATAHAGGVIFVAMRTWKSDRKLAFFWLWPLPFLFATSNLIPAGALQTRLLAERWLYLPYLGCCATLAYFLVKKVSSPGFPRQMLGRVLAASVLLMFALISALRAAAWSDERELWAGLTKIYPWSAKAEEGLGEAYARSGRCAQALPEFQKALALRDERKDDLLAHYVPLANGMLRWDSPSLYRWLGDCETQVGDLRDAERYFKKSIELDPNDGYSYGAMALSYEATRDYARARRWIDAGLKRDPNDQLLLQIKSRLRK